MDKFRRGFGNLPPRWDAEYPWRLYYVDLYFTDTFQYAKLDNARILAHFRIPALT